MGDGRWAMLVLPICPRSNRTEPNRTEPNRTEPNLYSPPLCDALLSLQSKASDVLKKLGQDVIQASKIAELTGREMPTVIT